MQIDPVPADRSPERYARVLVVLHRDAVTGTFCTTNDAGLPGRPGTLPGTGEEVRDAGGALWARVGYTPRASADDDLFGAYAGIGAAMDATTPAARREALRKALLAGLSALSRLSAQDMQDKE